MNARKEGAGTGKEKGATRINKTKDESMERMSGREEQESKTSGYPPTEKCMHGDWRDGSAVTSTDSLSRGPRFNPSIHTSALKRL